MKKIVLLSVLFFSLIHFIFGQSDDGNGFDVDLELDRMVTTPDSPEAFAFKQFGNTEVDMYRGMPNISIPLYILNGKDISISIALAYNSQDLKVENRPSRTGMGWSLNVGGRISRRVMGFTDDYTLGNVGTIYNNAYVKQDFENLVEWHNNGFDDINQIHYYFNLLDDLRNNEMDFSPDIYSLSALGLSANIYIDLNDNAIALNDAALKIEFQRGSLNSITSWIVNKDGVEYYFGSPEETFFYDFDGPSTTSSSGYQAKYNSSWVLTKIVNLKNNDVFEISYSSNSWIQPKPISANTKVNTPRYSSHGSISSWMSTEKYSYKYYRVTEKYPTRITYNGRTYVRFLFGDRADLLDSHRLEGINIIDEDNSNSIKKINFKYDYFGLQEGGNINDKRPEDLKLKLDRVVFSNPRNNTSTETQEYGFKYYNPEDTPPRDSKSQDMFGFYNGRTNSTLIPAINYAGFSFSGANRDFYFDKAITGILTKIEYPTDGYSIFNYEQAQTPIYSTSAPVLDINLLCDKGRVVHRDNLSEFDQDCIDFAGCPSDYYGEDLYSIASYATTYFTLNDTGSYNIDIIFNGLEPSNNSQIVAAIVKVNEDLGDIHPNEIVDFIQSGGGESIYKYRPRIPRPVQKQLGPGNYQVVILNRLVYPVQLIVNRLDIPDPVDPYIIGINYYPTFRLKESLDYTKLNNLDYRKTYSYFGAKQNVFPQKYYENNQLDFVGGKIKTILNIYQLSNQTNADESIVTYSEINENIHSIADPTNSYKKTYNFDNMGNKGTKYNLSSYGSFSNFYTNPKKGQLTESSSFTIDNALIEKSISDNQQETLGAGGYIGISTRNNWNQRYKVPVINYSNSTGKYYITYMDYEITGGLGLSSPISLALPQGCFDGTYNCLGSTDATLGEQLTLITSNISKLSSVTKSSYFDGLEVVQSEDRFYNENHLLSSIKNESSDNKTIISNYSYPQDLTDPTLAEQKLITQNRVATPIKTKITTEDSSGNILSTQKQYTKYKNWGNNIVLPDTIQTSKGDGALENRLIYHDYDDYGNPLEVSKADGTHIVYIWGYHQTQPIAKIENATYTQIENLINGLDLQTKSNADNDRTLGYTGNEGTLRKALDNLRANLNGNQEEYPNAMVTTYTYDPLIGVTSITDPRGDVVYYHYDDLNRLKHVKDKDGNILSKNEYHYRNPN